MRVCRRGLGAVRGAFMSVDRARSHSPSPEHPEEIKRDANGQSRPPSSISATSSGHSPPHGSLTRMRPAQGRWSGSATPRGTSSRMRETFASNSGAASAHMPARRVRSAHVFSPAGGDAQRRDDPFAFVLSGSPQEEPSPSSSSDSEDDVDLSEDKVAYARFACGVCRVLCDASLTLLCVCGRSWLRPRLGSCGRALRANWRTS